MSWSRSETTEFTDWFASLGEDDQDAIIAALDELELHGPGLGRPWADTLKGSRIANLKELRPITRGPHKLRVIFVFDPARTAVLLLGGDKTGKWESWYEENIPMAEALYARHLEELREKQAQMRAEEAPRGHSRSSKASRRRRS